MCPCLLLQSNSPPPKYCEGNAANGRVKGYHIPDDGPVVQVEEDTPYKEEPEEEQEDPWALVAPKSKGKPWEG